MPCLGALNSSMVRFRWGLGLLAGMACAVQAGTPATADVIYLCEGHVAAVVLPTGAPAKSASQEPCVRDWASTRRREAERKKVAENWVYGRGPTGATTRDFCIAGEVCRQPLPTWPWYRPQHTSITPPPPSNTFLILLHRN
jgi:hypothetical protein